LFGIFDSLAHPGKRRALLNPKAWRLPYGYHALFACMFFAGPYFSNYSTIITKRDFYPVPTAGWWDRHARAWILSAVASWALGRVQQLSLAAAHVR